MKRVRFAILIALVLGLVFPTLAQAQGLGLSGNFYRQHFELSPGQTSSGADVYVLVSNPDKDAVRVKMITETPPGVSLRLSQNDFTLNPAGQSKVNIGVEVSTQATPGEYTLTVSAEAYREGTGIKVTAGTQQQAQLSILGESGRVVVTSVTEDGGSFAADIGIYQTKGGSVVPVRPSEKSKLEARLVPGNYLAQAYYQNIKVAEQGFSLANNEEKSITLTCHTLSLPDFSVSPVYSSDNKLISVKIGYTIANLQKQLSDVRATLKVKLDGQPLEEMELTSFSTLDIGSRSGSYSYNPTQGWQQKHKYSFLVELYAQNKLYYQSLQQELTPGATSSAVPSEVPSELPSKPEAGRSFGGLNWLMVGGITAGVVIIAVIVLLIRRRRAY